MKKVAILLIISAILICLVGCNNGSGIPEGMQVVRQGDAAGYYMYAPEEWTVSNRGEISMAYASRIDLSSVSYVEAPMPTVTAKEYFEQLKSEFPAPPTMVIDGESCDFGSAEGPADSAIKFVYDYEYSEHNFRVMQILTEYQGRFGIFTFTSYNEKISSDELTQYDYYLEKVQSVIENFRFVSKMEADSSPAPEYDADGYRLVSDAAIAGFSLYLPEGYEVNFASGIVSASKSDGSTLTLSKATQTGTGIIDYLKARKESMQGLTKDFRDIKITLATKIDPESTVYNDWSFDVMPVQDEELCFGNLQNNRIICYEYEYSYNGKIYRVYQIMGVNTFNGFTLTYTAETDTYAQHIDEIKAIAEKVIF